MSSQGIRSQTNNSLTVDTDRFKVFIQNNRFEDGTMLNATGGELTYPIGTVLGRVAASNKLVPMASAAIDGSQYPVGILADEIILASSGEVIVPMCTFGQVDKSRIVLDGSDALTTVVESKTIEDRIKSDTRGVELVVVTDNTFYDN